jgi:hypothetical protein
MIICGSVYEISRNSQWGFFKILLWFLQCDARYIYIDWNTLT